MEDIASSSGVEGVTPYADKTAWVTDVGRLREKDEWIADAIPSFGRPMKKKTLPS
jgi:hypothetical protein